MTIDLLTIAKFFLRLSVIAVVIVMPSTFFPFIGGKYYFFRVCIELSLAFVVLWWGFFARPGELEERVRAIFKNKLVVAVSAFALAYLLAAIFAYDSHAAFWSNYERGEGAFQMLHYYGLFILAVFLLRGVEDWGRILKYSLWAGALLIIYGFMAASLIGGFVGYTGGDSLTAFDRVFSQNRFQGSLGNPAYVAPYLIFSTFIALWVWRSRKSSLLRSAFYVLLILFYLTFVYLSQTRGAFLGLVAAVLGFFAYLVIFGSNKKVRKIGIISGLIFAAVFFTLVHYSSDLSKAGVIGSRLFEVGFSVQTIQTRLWTWGSAWQGFKERPIFGWGPENFSTVFDKYFDPRHHVPGQHTETWFDRAHSIVFDYLAETGIVGFFSFVSIFVMYYVGFFKKFHSRKVESHGDKHSGGQEMSPVLRGLLFSIPIAYVVQGLALFDVIPTYINLFLVLAFAAYTFDNHQNHQHELARK